MTLFTLAWIKPFDAAMHIRAWLRTKQSIIKYVGLIKHGKL